MVPEGKRGALSSGVKRVGGCGGATVWPVAELGKSTPPRNNHPFHPRAHRSVAVSPPAGAGGPIAAGPRSATHRPRGGWAPSVHAVRPPCRGRQRPPRARRGAARRGVAPQGGVPGGGGAALATRRTLRAWGGGGGTRVQRVGGGGARVCCPTTLFFFPACGSGQARFRRHGRRGGAVALERGGEAKDPGARAVCWHAWRGGGSPRLPYAVAAPPWERWRRPLFSPSTDYPPCFTAVRLQCPWSSRIRCANGAPVHARLQPVRLLPLFRCSGQDQPDTGHTRRAGHPRPRAFLYYCDSRQARGRAKVGGRSRGIPATVRATPLPAPS